MNNKKILVFCIPIVFLVICIGTSIGSSNINIIHTISILSHKIFSTPLIEGIDPNNISIIWNLRLPRVLLAFVVGGALAASGAVVQSVLKNELASPYTLGVSAGASLGAGLVMVLSISIPFLGSFTLPLVGFLFGLFTVFFVVMFSSKIDKRMSNNTIILSGMVFSLFVNAILTLISALFSDQIKSITLWQMGSFAMKGWSSVGAILSFFVVGIIGIMLYTREMDVLTFGEEQALAVGVNVSRVKSILFIMAATLTGSAVSLSGTIGFVDLIAPHVVRKLVGSRHNLVIPLSIAFGGCLMVLTDLLSRIILKDSELPVGAITAIFGAPFFAYIYFKKSK
ncbi:MAG: iron ABC transporter permease [Clostridium sp.]